MEYKVQVSKTAQDQIDLIPSKTSLRLLTWINSTLSKNPEAGIELRGKLAGTYGMVTDNKSYRVIYTFDNDKATVLVVQVVRS